MEIEQKILPNILITGTPGVGKSTFAKILSEIEPRLTHFNVGELINKQKLYKNWNDKYNLPEFDDDLVIDFLEPYIQKGGCIIDFHSSAFFPERWFQLIVLLRANNTVLFDRLEARGYTQEKIEENIQCEIMEVTSEEVYTSYQHDIILEIKNEQDSDFQNNLNIIIERLKQLK